MATVYALQHRTSRRYLAADPACHVYVETADEHNAYTWSTMTESILAQVVLDCFADAWEVVPVSRPAPSPYPLEREGLRVT